LLITRKNTSGKHTLQFYFLADNRKKSTSKKTNIYSVKQTFTSCPEFLKIFRVDTMWHMKRHEIL